MKALEQQKREQSGGKIDRYAADPQTIEEG